MREIPGIAVADTHEFDEAQSLSSNVEKSGYGKNGVIVQALTDLSLTSTPAVGFAPDQMGCQVYPGAHGSSMGPWSMMTTTSSLSISSITGNSTDGVRSSGQVHLVRSLVQLIQMQEGDPAARPQLAVLHQISAHQLPASRSQ